MAIEKKKKGTGITEYEATYYSGPDTKPGFNAMAKSWNKKRKKGGGNYGAVSLDAIESARNIFKDSGDEPLRKTARRIFPSVLWYFTNSP